MASQETGLAGAPIISKVVASVVLLIVGTILAIHLQGNCFLFQFNLEHIPVNQPGRLVGISMSQSRMFLSVLVCRSWRKQ